MRISIAIAAYNAELNIDNLLQSLLSQQTSNFEIAEILVHSDQSSDNTEEIVKSVIDPRVRLIVSAERKGYAGSLITLLKQTIGDVVVTLNDDIKIKDNDLIKKLISPFINNSKVGMACCQLQTLPAKSFVESAINSTVNAYVKMREHLPNKNNKFTIDGKVMAFSRAAINSFEYPENLKLMANADIYMYFECLTKGFEYRFVKDAIAYYRNPSTVKDYLRWTIRNNSNVVNLEKIFGHEIVEREHRYNKGDLIKYSFLEFLKNPLGCLFVFCMRFYILYRAKFLSRNFNEKWEPIQTSKQLD